MLSTSGQYNSQHPRMGIVSHCKVTPVLGYLTVRLISASLNKCYISLVTWQCEH